MINQNEINLTTSLYQKLINWGVKEEYCQVEHKDSKVFVRKIITGKKKGSFFKLSFM